LGTFEKINENGIMKNATTRLLLKRKVPDRGQGQRENHLHSKTRLHDYHDC